MIRKDRKSLYTLLGRFRGGISAAPGNCQRVGECPGTRMNSPFGLVMTLKIST